MAKIVKQLSIFLDEEPDSLERVCKALGKAGSNVLGISVSDAVDHAVVRLVTAQPEKAKHILEEYGGMVVETDILSVPLSNKPGSLARIAGKLAKAGVTIHYAYSAVLPKAERGAIYFCVSDVDKAVDAL